MRDFFTTRELIAGLIIWLTICYALGCKLTGSWEPWCFITPDNLLGLLLLAAVLLALVILFLLTTKI